MLRKWKNHIYIFNPKLAYHRLMNKVVITNTYSFFNYTDTVKHTLTER